MRADEFDEAAKSHTFRRWNETSLAVVRALLVDGASTGEVAERFGTTTNQAWVWRDRFVKKYSKAKAEEFMRRNVQEKAPELPEQLETFRAAIVTLSENGYSDERIAEFLAENELKVTPADVRRFLEILKGQK
jgi:transposase-like protein